MDRDLLAVWDVLGSHSRSARQFDIDFLAPGALLGVVNSSLGNHHLTAGPMCRDFLAL